MYYSLKTYLPLEKFSKFAIRNVHTAAHYFAKINGTESLVLRKGSKANLVPRALDMTSLYGLKRVEGII